MLVFFPVNEAADVTANEVEKLSATEANVVDNFLPDEETSCCDGLSPSSAGLVLEL